MKKHSILFIALAFVMSIALGGCGGDKTKTESGSVVIGITQELDSLDPHRAVAAGTHEVLFNIFEGLVKPDSEGNLNPAVASMCKVNETGDVYTFTLRDGITFHNGNAVTVDDIVYSIRHSAGLEADASKININKALSKNLKSVEATDDKTVVLTLNEPDTEFLAYMTASDCAIVPADYDAQASSPMGTGPYAFVSYTPLESLVVKAYDGYWNEDKKPQIENATFKISASSDAAFLELQSGGIDILSYLTDEQAKQASSSNFDVKIGNMNLVQGLFLNNDVEPFNNKKVREALNYAVDKQAIIDMVADGHGSPIGSNMFTGLATYYYEAANNVYHQDTEKAKALLAEAGYADGLSFTVTVPSNYQFHIDTAQVIVEQLKEVGITVDINLIDWTTWLNDVYYDRNYQATVVGIDGNLAPKDLMERYASDADNNFVNFKDAKYDEVLKKTISTTDEAEKISGYNELQEILAKEAASVYLQDPALIVAVNKKIGGYTFYPVYVQDLSSLYFVE